MAPWHRAVRAHITIRGDAPWDGKAALTARAPCGGRPGTGAGGAPPSCGGGVARRSRLGAGRATRCGRTRHEADAPHVPRALREMHM